MSSMRVFLDARLAARGLGIGSATRRLIGGFDEIGFTSLRVNATTYGWTRRGKIDTVLRSGLLDVMPALDPRTSRAEVIHFFGNTAPRFAPDRAVVTVHDLMMLRSASKKASVYRSLLVPGLKYGKFPIVAISSQTASDLLGALPTLTDRVEVIPHGWRPGRFYDGDRGHVLMFSGSSDPRKRVDLGLAAYARYVQLTGARALPLVIAGRAGIDRNVVAASGAMSVRVESDPDDARVAELLASAACLIYPSREEGYGLPIVEAGETGTPVVLDGHARLPSEPMGAHVVAVDRPDDIVDWALSIQRAVRGGAVQDALRGLPTWSDVATEYLSLYSRVHA